MIPNKKHQIFADEYILSSDSIASYQKAYPKAQPESARVESYRLLQNTTIENYIKEGQDKIRLARQNNVTEELKNKDSSQILKREEVLKMTSNVVKLTYNSFLKSKDKQDADAFNKSVAVYSKLEGLDAPTKIENSIIASKEVAEEVKKTIADIISKHLE